MKLQQYVLEPVITGNLDDHTVDLVIKTVKTCLESSYDLHGFSVAVNRKLKESSIYEWLGVARLGRNIFMKMEGFKRPGRNIIMIFVKFHSFRVRSLQDLAAYQVACSVKSKINLEQLPVPPLIKRIVGKFIEI